METNVLLSILFGIYFLVYGSSFVVLAIGSQKAQKRAMIVVGVLTGLTIFGLIGIMFYHNSKPIQ